MRTARYLLPAAGIVFVLGCAAPERRQGGSGAEDHAAVRLVLDQRRTAIERSDAAAWLAVWTEDARLIRPFGGEDVVGREALRTWAAPFFEKLQMQCAETVEEISIHDDWAFARVTDDFRMTPKTGGASNRDLETGLVLFRKDAADNWRISHAMLASAPPQAPAR
jgi:uncharacterized protein (TIGR02246 family)